jgi:nitrile hydratase
LLENGTKGCEELGLDIPALKLVVVENTPQVHNAIVCTLCSCYPRVLLGIPPDWYKSRDYRSRMVREPRVVLEEFGLRIPENDALRVHDSTADMRYLVLPMRPAGTEGWSEERLAALVNRDSMIGVALPKQPT